MFLNSDLIWNIPPLTFKTASYNLNQHSEPCWNLLRLEQVTMRSGVNIYLSLEYKQHISNTNNWFVSDKQLPVSDKKQELGAAPPLFLNDANDENRDSSQRWAAAQPHKILLPFWWMIYLHATNPEKQQRHDCTTGRQWGAQWSHSQPNSGEEGDQNQDWKDRILAQEQN